MTKTALRRCSSWRRHALARLLDHERFDRVVVPATTEAGAELSGDDLVWLLEKAPAGP